MKSAEQREQEKRNWQVHAEQMYDELSAWREAHPEASFDEIGDQVTLRRQVLMGELLSQLAVQQESEEVCNALRCEQCGSVLTYKGQPQRGVVHLEGEATLRRAYYHCPHCGSGVFPPGPAVAIGETHLESGDDRERRGGGDSDSIVCACRDESTGLDPDPDVAQ